MAKVDAPLLSLGATGTIGKALTFCTWKGLNVCKTRPVPSNPKTADQVTQRGHFADAVDKWHSTLYVAADLIAWATRVGKQRLIMTGFNLFVKFFIDVAVSGDTFAEYYGIAGVYSAVSDKVTITGDCNVASLEGLAYFYDESGKILGSAPCDAEADKSISTEVDFSMDPAPKYVCIVTDHAAHGGETGWYEVTTS